jgi:sigma-B regulation protein RsbU (phosphoserine phosphatase)
MKLTQDQIVETLRQTVMFGGLPDEALTHMLSFLEQIDAPTGQVVIEEGDTGDVLYVIASGKMRVDREQRTVRELDQYDVFGEWAVIHSAPRSASVLAIEDSLLLCIQGKPFLELVRAWPEAMMGVISEYNARILSYMQDLNTLRDQLEEVILPLGISIAQEDNPDQLVERILVEAMSLCNADAGTVYLRNEDNALDYAVMRIQSKDIYLGGTTGSAIPFEPLPMDVADGAGNVAVNVAQNVRAVNVPDVYADGAYSFGEIKRRDMQMGYRSVSCLAVALRDQAGDAMGVLQLVNAQDLENGNIVPFSAFQQLIIESLSAQAAVALNTQLLLRREQEFIKLEQDVHVARRIQAGFLPNQLPNVEGYEIAASFQPAREVAGDWYDAFMMTQNRRLGFVIADVVDKGVPAALFMALVRSLTRAFAQQNYSVDWTAMLSDEGGKGKRGSDDLSDIAGRRGRGQTRVRAMPSAGTMSLYNAVSLANSYILENHAEDNMFATLFFGMLNPDTGQVMYINAGHNPPFIVGSDGTVKASLPNSGAAVGMFPNIDYRIEEAMLEPGDTLYMYTDGVTEARNAAGEFLTEKGLLKLLDAPVPSAEALLAKVQSYLDDFMHGAVQADDITMLAVRRTT